MSGQRLSHDLLSDHVYEIVCVTTHVIYIQIQYRINVCNQSAVGLHLSSFWTEYTIPTEINVCTSCQS